MVHSVIIPCFISHIGEAFHRNTSDARLYCSHFNGGYLVEEYSSGLDILYRPISVLFVVLSLVYSFCQVRYCAGFVVQYLKLVILVFTVESSSFPFSGILLRK